jgi:hypothetical protein
MRARALLFLAAGAGAGPHACTPSKVVAPQATLAPQATPDAKACTPSNPSCGQCVHLCTELLACQSDAYNRELDPDTCVDACLAIGPLEPPPAPCLVHHSCMYKLCIEHFAESEKSRLQAVRL